MRRQSVALILVGGGLCAVPSTLTTKMKKITTIFIFLLLSVISSLYAATEDLTTQREIYLRADHALKKKDMHNYRHLASQIQTYPLYPYLIHEEFKHKIKHNRPVSITLKQLEDFKNNYPDFPYHPALRTLWLKQMAINKNWAAFVQGYKETGDEALDCYHVLAQFKLTDDKKILAHTKDLWLVGHSQPDACNALFKTWHKTGGLTPKLIWKRFKLAMQEKNLELAQNLSKRLPATQQALAKQWLKLNKNPTLINNEKWIQQLPASLTEKAEIFTQGVRHLAKNDAEKAMRWWLAHKDHYPFTSFQSDFIQRDIGITLAHQKNPLADEYLAHLPASALDQVSYEWRIRLALKELDWERVLKKINQLPPDLAQEKCWLYWRARALDHLGQEKAARIIYEQLAKTRNYYGFLASLRLKNAISLQHRDIAAHPQMMMQVASLPAMKRFEQLRLVGRNATARVEWFRALDKMNEEQIMAAAKIAQKMGLVDIAIFTALKTDHRDDIPLRFPLAYKDQIITQSKKHNLDPGWVYAIIRQESAFYTESVSPAGARGLMQLMPPTAKMVAKKYDPSYYSEDSLYQPQTNIVLGTAYLKELKERMYAHPLLATVAYNAGPSRIKKWLPPNTLDAQVWIETIPFKETREYVKNVITFSAIYRQQLGYPSALPLMMKPIPSQSI
ncbi:MAG: transglycosylase SLT domain-containing protein [Candidatus Berkiellales bacterium]